jgi:hypothetical protein
MTWVINKPSTTTKIRDADSILRTNFGVLEDWSDVDHYGLTRALSGHHRPGQCSILAIATSAVIDTLTDVPCAFGFATDINDFGYNDGTGWTILGGPIETGTKMVFYQDTAPAGWTIANTLDDKLIYVTKGSVAGGQTGGGVHTTGSWTINGFDANVGSHILTTAEIPSHTHTYHPCAWFFGISGGSEYINSGGTTGNTGATGGGGGHVHTMAAHDGTWRPEAYCMIICSKN